MKYLGKRLLLSGVILAMVGGSVAGVSDSVGAATKAKTELTKKTPVGKKAPKKVDYVKVRKQYATDLKDYNGWAKRMKKSNYELLQESNSYVTYETIALTKTKSLILGKSNELDKKLDVFIEKMDSLSKKVNAVNTVAERDIMDKAIRSLGKDQDKLVELYSSFDNAVRIYVRDILDVLYTTEVMFKKSHSESITENGLPTEFDYEIREYADDALLKAGREYANKKLAEGYSQERVADWYLTEFDDLVRHRNESTYLNLLKLNEDDIWKYKKPLMERKFDAAVLMMKEYNVYFDGLEARIDGMVKRDMKKVAF